MSANTNEIELLVNINEYLRTGNGDSDVLIGMLGEIVQHTSKMMQDENMWNYTSLLGTNPEIHAKLNSNLETILANDIFETEHLRFTKGFILLLRNFTLVNDLHFDTYRQIIAILKKLDGMFMEGELALKAVDISIVGFHCVFNFMKTNYEQDVIESAISTLNFVLDQLQYTGGLFELRQLLPLVKQICEIPETKKLIQEDHCAVIIKLLKSTSRILNLHRDINIEELHASNSAEYQIIVQVAQTMIYFYDDEKLGIAAYKLEKEPGSDNTVLLYLIACQMIFSSEPLESWDYVAIGAVILDFFHMYIERSTKLLQDASATDDGMLRLNHRKIIALFDIISNLMPYEMFKKVMNSYDVLEKLIGFFHVVENNTERKRLKEEHIVSMEKKSFGNTKTIMIEIITYFVHNDKGNQDLVRETGGLILILNNCNLDINEPFIRERSILCLKYLLENNPKNQEFVASLEAKGVEINEENEEVLEKCGYEVDIVDGKVKLKNVGNKRQKR